MAFQFDPKNHCQNLRCKEMYAHEPHDPEREARLAEESGTYDATAFWCRLTQTARGPDGERVHSSCCCQGRGCFVGLENLA